MLKETLQSLWSGILHFVYPRLCLGCNKSLLLQEQVLCLGCANDLPLTKYHHIEDNESSRRFVGRIRFEHATSFAYFTKDGLLQELLHEFKYKNNTEVGVFLAKRFAAALRKTAWIREVDFIIPVPLHHSKENKRGFNQSEIISQSLSSVLNIAVDSQSLIRIANTDSQVQKSRAERAENMSRAFSIKDTAHLRGKHVLLIDDVLTTGATLEACVLALQKTEGIRISIATLGIAMD